MHIIKIDHSNSHNFIVEINGNEVLLSYRNFGGRRAVNALGEEGLAKLIDETECIIVAQDFSGGCRPLFQKVGVSNAMVLLSVCCRNDFCTYWKELLCQRKRLGKGTSFRSVLAEVTGTKATLAQNTSSFVESLRELCAEVSQIESRLCVLTGAADEAKEDGLRVSFCGQRNNSLLFEVNGEVVSLCTRQVSEIKTTTDVLSAAQALQKAIINKTDLQNYVMRWGGSFVFRLLNAICPEATVDYFKQKTIAQAEQRTLVDSRKILKELAFPFNDRSLFPFCCAILSALEQQRNKLSAELASGNFCSAQESKDKWMLYYKKGFNMHYLRIDFLEIECENLRKETSDFLQAYLRANAAVPPPRIARYFYLLRSGLNALTHAGVISIKNATISHARFVKSRLDCHDGCSANHISETLQILGRMYIWSRPDSVETENPFWRVSIPNKSAFLQTTTPANNNVLKLVAAHLEELPEYVQIGHLLLLLTLARAGDAFSVRVSDLEFLNDGTGVLRYQSGKNGRRMSFHIPAALAGRLIAYIKKTEPLRDRSGSDYLLLYEPSGRRSDSGCLPLLLTYVVYNYHIGKLINQYAASYGLTTRQIRAEGGRRYHSMGLPSSQVAVALGNTPTVAKTHYRTLSPRDEAELFHQVYIRSFSVTETMGKETVMPQPMWGKCNTASCQSQNPCHTCPYLHTEEVLPYAVCAKSS